MLWVLTVSIIPNIWLSLTESLATVQAATNVILPCGIHMLLMSLSPRIGRASLWMIIVMFFAAFQIVLLYMYGRSVIAVDMFLNLVTTNPEEVGELLGNMLIIIAVIILLYIPPIAGGIIAVVKNWRLSDRFRLRFKRLSKYVAGLGIVLFACSFFCSRPYNPLNDLYPVNVLYNVYLAVERTIKTSDYHRTSAGYTFDAHSTRPDSIPEVYIAVIGETSRACNWQLMGYDRPTTPHLINLDGLYGYRRAISQSNTTHKSVPMLMSELDATTFGDSIYSTRSLITAFKEAGFHTAYISNQSRNHSFIDFFGEEADTCIFLKDAMPVIGGTSYDNALLPDMEKILAQKHRKQLIVLHTYGSHFSYADRYPAESSAFTPDGPLDATPAHRPKLINAYDNSIHFTSSLLASIAGILETENIPAAMIYTSDHGEDIFDDKRNLFLHASPIPSYYQIHVPYIVWLSSGFRNIYPDLGLNAKANGDKYVASSRSYFHTLIDLAGISTPRFDPTASTVNAAYSTPVPVYLNDHNEAVPLIDCGIQEHDIDKLHRIGVL